MTRPLARIEGRLFSEDGCLFLVVHADEAAGLARVSCRVDQQTQVIEMPLANVAARVSGSTGLILDNLNAPETSRRIVEQNDGWYFASREGQIGPFPAREEAGRKLAKYILSKQTDGTRTPREPNSGRAAVRQRAVD